MKHFSRIFTPTNNRRLNELIGFLLCVSALLLFLCLVSYSPLDPSWNSASVLTGSHAARNWIGVVGALVADITLQIFGIGAFLLPIFPATVGARWFRSRKIVAPVAKSLGGAWLIVFVPALLALLPGNSRWMHSVPDCRDCLAASSVMPSSTTSTWPAHTLFVQAYWPWRFIFPPRSHSLRFRSGRPHDLPSCWPCGTAIRIGRPSAPTASCRKNWKNGAPPSRLWPRNWCHRGLPPHLRSPNRAPPVRWNRVSRHGLALSV